MRHLANTSHLSKEAYLRKTPKNGKSRDKLLRYRFLQRAKEELKVSFKWSDGSFESYRQGPDEEAADAILLTIRMFYQPNDRLCLHKMDDFIQSLATDEVLKTRFSEIRSEFYSFLDAFPSVIRCQFIFSRNPVSVHLFA